MQGLVVLSSCEIKNLHITSVNSLSQLLVYMVPHLWIQPIMDSVVLWYFFGEKKINMKVDLCSFLSLSLPLSFWDSYHENVSLLGIVSFIS